MTEDLERTLKELGPGYREVVDRLTGAFAPVGADFSCASKKNAPVLSGRGREVRVYRTGHIFRWTAGYLVAASLLVFLGLGVLFRFERARAPELAATSPRPTVYTVAYAADEAALRAIVASQRADGSWSNDFITRQNAAALRGAADALSLVAYKRALRYLRSRGLEPLTDAELKARADQAARSPRLS